MKSVFTCVIAGAVLDRYTSVQSCRLVLCLLLKL